ncbi:response regulator transcription factor [Paenibacillus senegalimassiliensis]|uniref:response regulator transcription factor n=1 Tax=Paenibacillus senegalimassiliensis TaxID=1737426 RepID=UPI00073EE052|nr:response regulator transcription factor [Paenibacillus senegalimassiliensis]
MWKIAIIDDDFQVVKGLRAAIPWGELAAEFAGEAIDGQAGIQLIREIKPDIVLTDIYMPYINGIEMIEQLKSEGFAGRFVILSGYNDFEYARTALRLGVDDYLTKPVTLEQIASVLTTTIEKLEATYLDRLENGRMLNSQSEIEWLLSLLNGQEQPQQLPDNLAFWEQSKHVAIITEISWTERIRGLSNADWNLFRFAITNIVEEIMEQEEYSFRFVWLFGNHASLLIQASSDICEQTIQEDTRRIGELIGHQIMTYLGLSLRYAAGSVRSNWQNIKESANEATRCLLEQYEHVIEGSNHSEEQQSSLQDFVQRVEARTPVIHEKHRKAVQYMVEYVHQHYAEDITLEQLAQQLYISKNYLNQLFKKVTGETFTNYVIRVRIEKAKGLLIEGKYMIYEISEMVGYNNVPYFSTLFKKYCGCSPSELLKK